MRDVSSLALLVDVDGVVTDEHARVDSETISLLLQLATAGAALAFVSGRSRTWLETNLLPVLLEHAPPSLVDSLSFAAEMGAVRKGRSTAKTWQVSPEHAVPGELRQQLIPLIARHDLEELIEWDSTKEATATFESIHRPDLPGHAERARQALVSIVSECGRLAEQFGCRAALSTYALDVLAPTLSKRVGAEFALQDFGDIQGLSRVLVFGDSAGDLAMAEYAQSSMTSAGVEFFWVGRGPAPSAQGFPVRASQEPHAPGTASMLRTLLHHG